MLTINTPANANYSFNGHIVDDGYGSASATKLALTKTGEGTQVLACSSSYSGPTTIYGGVLQANDNAGLPHNSFLTLDSGILQSNGAASFTRSLGTSGSTFEWTANGGGFSAYGGADDRQHRRRGRHGHLGHRRRFGNHGDALVELLDRLRRDILPESHQPNGADRTIQVVDNPAYAMYDYGYISGDISGTGGIVKTGNGLVALSGDNTYSGTTTIADGANPSERRCWTSDQQLPQVWTAESSWATAGAVTRSLGTTGNTFQWTANGGGFAAGN